MLELLVLRIIFAGIVGFIIGVMNSKSPSARMFSMICTGAALVTIVSIEFFKTTYYPWMADPGRISAQIISALGFIGTGLIWISEDKQIKGVSNAASLWVTAILGMLIGAGLQHTSVIGTFIVVIIYWLANHITICKKKPE
ncbi:MAG: MgtC/SapB family protein [Syntrophomonadaceae bacterium]|nr:MgtC/SapB family protein [Syntrophomonadaceae bacterium]MDD3889013.1 MgtC/SapB family protein [Syntrophomonadaceae bacterium]MDD4548288.1 MgtC/SapB family protein [Syntrophomonadaceae bacterium]